MEFKDIVRHRYAAKKFSADKIPEDKINELIELIRFTPSAINLQPCRIKIISDSKVLETLTPATFGQEHAVKCSHLLVLCANTDINDVIKNADLSMKAIGYPDERRITMMKMAGNMKEKLNLQWAREQVFLVLGNAVIAAKALGFDSCPMTGFDPKILSSILGLPANLVPIALCPLGYGADTAPPKARLSINDFLIK